MLGALVGTFGGYTAGINVSGLMLRLCRTYGLNPKDYSEVISSGFVFALGAGMAVGGAVGASVTQAIGYQRTNLYFAIAILCTPFLLLTAFHPSVLKAPLAPETIDETTSSRLAGSAKAVSQPPPQLPTGFPGASQVKQELP